MRQWTRHKKRARVKKYDKEDDELIVLLLSFCACSVKTQGIGTSKPELKIGETTFEGKVEPIVGTTLAFKAPPAGDKGTMVDYDKAVWVPLSCSFESVRGSIGGAKNPLCWRPRFRAISSADLQRE